MCMGQLCAEEQKGQAAKEGRVSATALTWGILGVGLLVAIGVVIAVVLSQDNNKTVVVVQH